MLSCYQWGKDMNIIVYLCQMKIEEAIVYCLATSNRGMRSECQTGVLCGYSCPAHFCFGRGQDNVDDDMADVST